MTFFCWLRLGVLAAIVATAEYDYLLPGLRVAIFARAAAVITLLDTPCREWQGRTDRRGYGRLSRDGVEWFVHRWVWTLANGAIPEGLNVLHRCDNPPCFRLDHLWLGTHKDNHDDMHAKGRYVNGMSLVTHCPKGHEYTTENTRLYRGKRHCRACNRERGGDRHRERRGG